MRSLSPEHAAQRAQNVADRRSYVCARGEIFRRDYELEDAEQRCRELEAENANLRAQLAALGRHQD